MQRAFAEGLRIEAGGADVEIRVERSVRHHFQRQSDAGESVHHECPAFQQFLPALLAYAQRLRCEAGQCGVLRRRMGAEEEVRGQIVHRIQSELGNHHPPQTPAGHAEEFRETAAHHGFRVDGERRLHTAAVCLHVGQVQIGLVHNAPCTMVCRVRAYVTQYVGRDRGTGGVGGRRDHHRACALAPVLPDERLIEVEARRRGRGHVDHLAAEGPHQLAVRRVRRVCDDHLVALVDAQCGRQQQCRRTSFGDHDAFRTSTSCAVR